MLSYRGAVADGDAVAGLTTPVGCAGIAGVYDKSELLPERRAALELWVAHVEGLVAGKPTKGRRGSFLG